jgi:hypothetical protein
VWSLATVSSNPTLSAKSLVAHRVAGESNGAGGMLSGPLQLARAMSVVADDHGLKHA